MASIRWDYWTDYHNYCFFLCDMSTECKCYRLELRSKMARLLSRCVSVRAPSWIETVNVGSYKQNLTPRDLISPRRVHIRGELLLSAMLLYTRHLKLFHRLVPQARWEETVSMPVPFLFFFFQNHKGKAVQSSWASIGELRLYVSPVLALYPSPVQVCISGQVSLTSLAFHFFYPLICL